jgi:ubiquinol-cytochrome c reductase cytochrome c subunit
MRNASLLGAVAVSTLLLGAVLPQGAHAQAAGDAARGKATFVRVGCWECHGTLGQGAPFGGPSLAPHPIAFDNLLAYIRAPRGEMPPYDEHILPESDARDIYAYLQSIPVSKPATEIPLLNGVTTGNAGAPPALPPGLARGREIFAMDCEKCHVSAPIGPSLANEKSRKDLTAVVTFVKAPAPPMPKLYPAPLSDRDVDDVAAYVESL